MNTDQVVEMIDAITEGRPYDHTWESANLSDALHLATTGTMARFGIRGEVFDVEDPRTAREIAGALVAWANRKQGHNVGAQFLGRLAVSILSDGSVGFPSVNDWAHIKAGRDSRANWYARNVKNMSQETKDRNLKDLIGIQAEMHPNDMAQIDIAAAIQILRDNGAKDV